MISGSATSISKRLRQFFESIGNSFLQTPSKSAFSQARYKLKHTALQVLHRYSVEEYYLSHPHHRRWRGYRLLGIDGSTTPIPSNEDTVEHFGWWRPKNGQPIVMGRITQMTDLLNGIVVDGRLLPFDIGERLAAQNHFEFVGNQDLVILDRGYACFWMMQAIQKKEADFVMRLEESKWSAAKSLLQNRGQWETIIELEPPQDSGIPNECIPV